jgi:hypothetical protein
VIGKAENANWRIAGKSIDLQSVILEIAYSLRFLLTEGVSVHGEVDDRIRGSPDPAGGNWFRGDGKRSSYGPDTGRVWSTLHHLRSACQHPRCEEADVVDARRCDSRVDWILSTLTADVQAIKMSHGTVYPHPAAVLEKAAMSLLCLIYVLLCVRSFINARVRRA